MSGSYALLPGEVLINFLLLLEINLVLARPGLGEIAETVTSEPANSTHPQLCGILGDSSSPDIQKKLF